MRRYYSLLMLLIVAVTMVSCVEEVKDLSSNEQEVSFTASFESSEATKTVLVGGKDVYWLPGDYIYVSGTTDPLFTDITEPSAEAVFSGVVKPSDIYYSIYPFHAVSVYDDVVSLNIPSEQEAVKGSFANYLNISAAVTSAQDMNLRFHNLLGYMKFTIGEESGSIVSVKVEPNSGDPVAGTVVVNFDSDTGDMSFTREHYWDVTLSSGSVLEPGDYYIAMLPGTFPTGLTLTFTDDQQRVAEKSVYSELTLEAGVIQNIGTVSGLVFENVEDILARERQALIDIYKATGGENWFNNTNWCSDLPVGEWAGVYTDANGYVNSLDFFSNNLKLEVDSFPSRFADLTHLNTLYLMMESSVFPDALCGLERLSYLELDLPTYIGEVPERLEDLKCLKHLSMSGGFTSMPEFLGSMTQLEYLQFFGSKMVDSPFSGGIPDSISNLHDLKHLNIGCFNIATEIPEWVYDMTSLEYLKMNGVNLHGQLSEKISQLKNLKTLDFSENNLEGPIPNGLVELSELKYLYLFSNNFTGTLPEGFIHLENLIEIWIYANRLSGNLPYDFEQNKNYELWGVDQNVLVQQLGYILSPSATAYESTDFSKDGEVIILQKASVGNGVNIVLLGDGFVDRDMGEGGVFEEAMREAVDHMFSLEPMKTYKEYFNIYAVKAVSKHERFADGYETALETGLGAPPAVGGNLDRCVEYALKSPVTSTEDLTIAVVVKANIYAGMTYWLDDNLAIAYAGMSRPVDGFYEKTFGAGFIHEVVGHGFGKLADEYVYFYETYPDAGDEELRQSWIDSGYCANIDITDDRGKIKWAHMLNDERFSSYTGVVEGADLFAYGIWRPEQRSMMNACDPYFNAPSREALVRRIVTLAGETHTFEKFAEKDVYEPIVRTRSGDTDHSFEPLPSPVRIHRSL